MCDLLIHGDDHDGFLDARVVTEQVLVSHSRAYAKFSIEMVLCHPLVEKLQCVQSLGGVGPCQLQFTEPPTIKEGDERERVIKKEDFFFLKHRSLY